MNRKHETTRVRDWLDVKPRLDADGKQVRALGLCSGGLDSLLSLAVVRNQGVDVLALTFVSPFLTDDNAVAGCRRLGIPHRRVDFTPRHLEVVKNPRYGYGSNMNPCLDCHALMIRIACGIADEEGFHFIFTGEVLGQRPMSQNRIALQTVVKASGCGDRLIRPLSAQRMNESLAERMGWLDRERLYGITGRSRKEQIALADEYGIVDYPTPAGGCPLTDPGFSHRLRHLLDLEPEAEARIVELLNWGRHFMIGEKARVIIGRKKAENDALEKRITSADIVLYWADGPGPLGVIPIGAGVAEPDEDQLSLAAAILLSYTREKGDSGRVRVTANGQKRILNIPRRDKAEYGEIMVN